MTAWFLAGVALVGLGAGLAVAGLVLVPLGCAFAAGGIFGALLDEALRPRR